MADVTIQACEVRRIAVTAQAAPETVRRYFEGKPIRSLSELRIKAALKRLGIADPTRAPEPAK